MVNEDPLFAMAIDLENALVDKLGMLDLPNAQEDWLVNPRSGKKMSTKYPHGRDSGALASGIKVSVTPEGLEIDMEDYAKFLEFGTPNPTTPSEILSWVNSKIMSKAKKRSSKASQRIAESLAKHISTFGPRPFPFVRTTLKEFGILEGAVWK